MELGGSFFFTFFTFFTFMFVLLFPSDTLVRVSAFDTIHGCGGFIEPSLILSRMRKPSDPKLDYSAMAVELLTMDGLVKERTHCAPNGYYFVPVYDKGTFQLRVKGPEGWSWEPGQATVAVDARGCNGNEDINFRYTGFTLSGRVLGASGGHSCPNEGEGPAGVKVSLSRIMEENVSGDKILASTSSGGIFKFLNLIPGEYKLEASHPKLQIEKIGSSEVRLGLGNVEVDNVFFAPGYPVEGLVVSQGNPVLGVQVYLYSDDVMEVSCAKGPGNPPWTKQALCHAVSDVNGKFFFDAVPCGQYKLLPYYKGENTVFDVSPSVIDITVAHNSLSIPQPFQVTGFSIAGRVVDNKNVGLEGVSVLVNDVERAVTDANGFYKLDQVTSTQYTIKAQKAHYKFSSLDNFMVLPNMASVLDIKSTSYELCGSVILVDNTVTWKRQVALTHGPPDVKPQLKRVDEHGSFCFEIPPGEYRVTPVTTESDNHNGLIFTPPYLDLPVHGPVLDVIFTQAQVNIHGTVTCKTLCTPDVLISLTPLSSPHATAIDTSRKKLTKLSVESNAFTFEKVLPGNYRLEVSHKVVSELPGSDDDWCWEKKYVDVSVGIDDLKNIHFLQTGYKMFIKSTHPTSALIVQPSGENLPMSISKGWQETCVENPGVYEIQFIKPCVLFGIFPFRFDTFNPTVVELVGERYLLSGKLYIDAQEHASPEQLADSIAVDIWRDDGSFADSKKQFRVLNELDQSNSTLVLEYNQWARMDDRLKLVPRHLRDQDLSGLPLEVNSGVPLSKQILFYPQEINVSVNVDGCQPEVPPLFGRPGLYLEGKITPALDDVNIAVISKIDSPSRNLKRGDLVLKVTTGVDGVYIAGPLYDDAEYVVEAEKEGYYLKKIDDLSFSCQKLGQIMVHILPGSEAEDPLPSVLLSLSGDNGYRKNAMTGVASPYSFASLFPGSFFLRPLLKEYAFEPAAQAIELGSGELLEVNFAAHRVAYSIMGTVRSLSGKTEDGIPMEARSESQGYYEETLTDSDGRYRLRGLQAGSTYVVKVVSRDIKGESRVERASPSSVSIQVEKNDTCGVDFVIFEQSPVTLLTGYVEGSELGMWQPHLSVKISSFGDSAKVEKLVPLPLSYFFEAQGLPKGKYSVELISHLSEKTHRFISDTIVADLDSQPQLDIGPLRYVAEERQQKHDLTPASVLPLAVGVLIIIAFASMPRLNDAYQWLVGSGSSVVSSLSAKKEVRKAIPRKRAY